MDPAIAEIDELVIALRSRAQSNAAQGRAGYASGRKRTASRYGRRAALDSEVADRLEEQAALIERLRANLANARAELVRNGYDDNYAAIKDIDAALKS